MLDQILATFDITPDYDLDIMRDNQSLTGVTISTLRGPENVLCSGAARLVGTEK